MENVHWNGLCLTKLVCVGFENYLVTSIGPIKNVTGAFPLGLSIFSMNKNYNYLNDAVITE